MFFTNYLAEIALVLFAIAVVLVILFANVDCDISLKIASYFGKQPESFAGKVVWITGASSGIGEEIAYIMSKAGALLVLSGRRQHALERVRKRCVEEFLNENILVVPLDMTQVETFELAVKTVLQHFEQVDVLINNAGRTQRCFCIQTALEVDKDIYATNVVGALSLTKLVLPHMVARKSGHIIVVTSIAGRTGAVGGASYAASKSALHAWYDSLRMEMAEENIDITLVAPGSVFSNILETAFTETPGKELSASMRPDGNRMATGRCAYLIAVAAANRVYEGWIANQPELLYLYLNQYTPTIFRWLQVKFTKERVQKLKAGIYDINA